MNQWLSPTFDFGAESRDEAGESLQALELAAGELRRKLELEPVTSNGEAARIRLQLSAILLQSGKSEEAWCVAREAFLVLQQQHDWPGAIEALDTMFRSEQSDSLAALGHAVWLSVTFPVEVAITLSQLQHIIDQTPDDSDGAAVAAAMAAYVAELRSEAGDDSLVQLKVNQMLSQVAREHAGISEQSDFERWFRSLELDQPDKLIVRLRNVIDVLVQDDWWIDRDALQDEFSK